METSSHISRELATRPTFVLRAKKKKSVPDGACERRKLWVSGVWRDYGEKGGKFFAESAEEPNIDTYTRDQGN